CAARAAITRLAATSHATLGRARALPSPLIVLCRGHSIDRFAADCIRNAHPGGQDLKPVPTASSQ
ncbi:MAG TPA: hypothetical protein VLE48_04750, partial [Terriglobales bacterium]|nr:hypothetical protein [Terriglobales bacterium]